MIWTPHCPVDALWCLPSPTAHTLHISSNLILVPVLFQGP